ncbi:MAG TPA: branched-chain amino acid ABC transporter permease, partial [Ensifer sp.]|nr:branched-chain amino acid ABC transporter permease [Ensifer sp.]
YFENIFSGFNENALNSVFSILPDTVREPIVKLLSLFVGEGWSLTLGLVFMAIVIFLPGGIMEGVRLLTSLFKKGGNGNKPAVSGHTQPAE